MMLRTLRQHQRKTFFTNCRVIYHISHLVFLLSLLTLDGVGLLVLDNKIYFLSFSSAVFLKSISHSQGYQHKTCNM